MPNPFSTHSPWCVGVAFVAGDTTKDLKAAPGAGAALVITNVWISITTSAAQAFDIEDNNGTPVEVAKFGASLAVGVYQLWMEKGIQLTANKKLVYTPAAAGPAGFIVVEGYVLLEV